MAATLQLIAALLLLTPLAQSQGVRRRPPPTRVSLDHPSPHPSFLPPGMDLNNPGGGGHGVPEPPIFFPSNMPFTNKFDDLEARGGEGVDIRFENSRDGASDIGRGPHYDIVDNMEDMDMDMKRALSKADTMEEWALMMGVDMPVDEEPAQNETVFLRFGGPTSTAIKPMKAGCAVENRTVELTLPSGDGKMYFPTCVRLPRCAGCCMDATVLQCRPTSVNQVSFKIMQVPMASDQPTRRVPSFRGRYRPRSGRYRYRPTYVTASGRSRSSGGRGRRTRRSANYHIVQEEEHVTCECLCRVQETDCDPAIQTYDKTNCQCACNNKDEMMKCEGQSSTHYWDKSTCKCLCHRKGTCSHSQYFDQTTCTCMNLMLRMGGASGRSGSIPGLLNFNSTHHYVPVDMPDQ